MGGTIKDPMGAVRDLSGSCTIEQLKAAVVAVKAAQASRRLHCQMNAACTEPITHIDNKGFAYCTSHGVARRAHCSCRKLRAHELRRLQRGETLTRY